MYYGELCIKVNNKGEKHTLTMYTRKRQNYVVEEGETVEVGSSIEFSSNDPEMITTMLLDTYTLVRQGMLSKEKTEKNGVIWSLRPNANFIVMSGPAILEFYAKEFEFTIDASMYTEDSMEPMKLGTITASNTGNVSLLQKITSALNQYGITAQDAREYARSMRED